MNIISLSEENHFLHVLNSKTRDKSIYGNELADVHKKIGEILCQYYLSQMPMINYEITTVQNKQSQTPGIDMNNLAIIVLLRAGLYLAEGARATLGNAHHSYILSHNPRDLDDQLIIRDNTKVLLVDSVINSGKSISEYIEKLRHLGVEDISCLSIVMQEDFYNKAVKNYASIQFITSRVSKNSFVGQGQTDTGNRLFGTL